jgi:hypothetical protein
MLAQWDKFQERPVPLVFNFIISSWQIIWEELLLNLETVKEMQTTLLGCTTPTLQLFLALIALNVTVLLQLFALEILVSGCSQLQQTDKSCLANLDLISIQFASKSYSIPNPISIMWYLTPLVKVIRSQLCSLVVTTLFSALILERLIQQVITIFLTVPVPIAIWIAT